MMVNDYTLYEILKDRPEATVKLVEWARQYDEFSDCNVQVFIDNIVMPTMCLKQYRVVLCDFFDSLKIICTIRTNYKGEFIPTVNDCNVIGYGKVAQKVYSSKGRETRIEAEATMFDKAFGHLEMKLWKQN